MKNQTFRTPDHVLTLTNPATGSQWKWYVFGEVTDAAIEEARHGVMLYPTRNDGVHPQDFIVTSEPYTE